MCLCVCVCSLGSGSWKAYLRRGEGCCCWATWAGHFWQQGVHGFTKRVLLCPTNLPGGETSWCGPRQKAVKEKVSVQTSATAALVCRFLVLQTLFKGLPLILVMKETWIPAGKSHRQGNTVMVCFAKCLSVLLFLHGPGGQTESWLYFIWSLPPSHVVSSLRKSL